MSPCRPLCHVSGSMLVLLLCSLLIGRTEGGFERNCDFYRPQVPLGICGKRLSDTLDTVCIFFNGRDKRSADSDLEDTKPKLWHTDPSIFLPKDKALSVLDRDKRGFYGQGRITCECCYYQCQLRELTQYCSTINANLMRKRGADTPYHPRDAKSLLAKQQEQQDVVEKQAIGRELLKKGDSSFYDVPDDVTHHETSHNEHY